MVTVYPFAALLRVWEESLRSGASNVVTHRAIWCCDRGLGGGGGFRCGDDGVNTLAIGTYVAAGDARCNVFVVTGEEPLVPNGALGTWHFLWAVRGALDELPAVCGVREVLLAPGAIHAREG